MNLYRNYPGESLAEETCFFVTDLHGRADRYRKLADRIRREHPAAVFMGGDLLTHVPRARVARGDSDDDFIDDFLAGDLRRLRQELGPAYPSIFIIMGNDDPRVVEEAFQRQAEAGLWYYMHNRKRAWHRFTVYGYACVPPTPFLLKDWERYDVSRYVDPGCVSPEEGFRSVPVREGEIRFGTIERDLRLLAGQDDMENAIFLFHSPPYRTALDRAALDGMQVERAPLDVHVGSVAVRKFIEQRQPRITLHGHIHESARLTGRWREVMGRTHALSAAHDGPELALIRFSPSEPASALRELI